MRIRLILFCIAAALLATPVCAQKKRQTAATRKKAAATSVLQQARQAIQEYDFEEACDLLTTAISTQKRRRRPTEDIEAMESLLEQAQRIATKLHATERILVIDSIVCPKEHALKEIRLTRESGRLDTYASTYHKQDELGITIYENELANKRYFAIPAEERAGHASPATLQDDDSLSTPPPVPLRMAVSDKIGDSWSKPTRLTGLDEEDVAQNYPFLLSDGVTLYYAAIGPESIGGYDIFVTRADGEDGSFLTPENIGFPFNSTANDYLLAIDEYAQLGWFVTDRNQPEGQVCVYVFVPNETREVYAEDLDDEVLRNRARLNSIRETWTTDADGDTTRVIPQHVRAARQRLSDIRSGKSFNKPASPDFIFVIDDNRTYTRISDFRNAAAKEKMQRYLQLHKNIETDATMLQRLRDNFATAQPAQRRQLAESIRRLEATHYLQQDQLQQLAKEIRYAEIVNK